MCPRIVLIKQLSHIEVILLFGKIFHRIHQTHRVKTILFQNLLCPRYFHNAPDIGAIGFHDLDPLRCTSRLHVNDQRVLFRCTKSCQGDSCVTAGGLDHSLSRLQLTGRLCCLQHFQRRSVLYAARWIEIFQLTEDLCFQLIFFLVVYQFQ